MTKHPPALSPGAKQGERRRQNQHFCAVASEKKQGMPQFVLGPKNLQKTYPPQILVREIHVNSRTSRQAMALESIDERTLVRRPIITCKGVEPIARQSPYALRDILKKLNDSQRHAS